MQSLLKFLHRRAEDVMVALMAVMFASFIVQIGSRYLFNAPTDWTYELILITWLWSVFWGAAFLLEDKDQVKFDIIYSSAAPRTRRVYALLSAIVLAGAFLISLPATYDFISFKSIRSSDILHIRLDVLFSVYLIFLMALILHYLIRSFRLIRGDAMDSFERKDVE